MPDSTPIIVWLQRDLRIQGNPSLIWALQHNRPVIAVYIHSPEEDQPWSEGAASRWWLHHSLMKLSKSLSEINIPLHCFNASSVKKIPQLITFYKADSICWTRRYEPYRVLCEQKIEQVLSKLPVQVKCFNDSLLQNPDSLLTATAKTPYRVFTPFYRRLRSELSWPEPNQSNTLNAINSKSYQPDTRHSVSSLALLDGHRWHEKLHQHWQVGEDAAREKLSKFKQKIITNYSQARDYPAIEGTSSLSPHLHFGEISPRQILSSLQPMIEFGETGSANEAEAYLRQLIWREFARYLLWHFPRSVSEPMNEKFARGFWSDNAKALQHWQRGDTGIALVDAGMKQLWQTGWMHNRVRMLVASMLTKNMGISWQAGACWFWDTLVDADLANNSMGWQWVAGCGVDAAPYFRIFNPDTQAIKFDRDQAYVKRWQGSTRLQPIVDLKRSRVDALDRYRLRIQLK